MFSSSCGLYSHLFLGWDPDYSFPSFSPSSSSPSFSRVLLCSPGLLWTCGNPLCLPLYCPFQEFSFRFWLHVLTPAAQKWICILEEIQTLSTSRSSCGCSLAWWLGIRWPMELHSQIPKVPFLWSLLCPFQLLHLWRWALSFCRAGSPTQWFSSLGCVLTALTSRGSLLSGISPVFLFVQDGTADGLDSHPAF